jgi:UDP-2-acetamido-3-amino-2,3-dideoxy-glucuronate N-acetyltransferase
MPNAEKPRIAVAGCGYWGRNLVRNFHSLGRLVAVADPSAAGRELAAEIAPGITIFDNIAALFDRPEIDGVVLATPAVTHAPLGLAALAAGKHLFVEKPLALSLSDGRALAEAASRDGRILQVGHLLEYHPAFEHLRGHADTRLGRLIRIQSHRTNFGKVRTEEDALWSLAPHDIAMILRLAGTLPETVSCTGTFALRTERADTAVAILRFAGGLDAHVLCSWIHPVKEQRLIAIGERGAAVFDDTAKDQKLVWHAQRVSWNNGQPILARSDPEPAVYPPEEPLRRECTAFLDAIASGRPPVTNAASGLRVLAVLEACRKSMEKGGEWRSVEHP